MSTMFLSQFRNLETVDNYVNNCLPTFYDWRLWQTNVVANLCHRQTNVM